MCVRPNPRTRIPQNLGWSGPNARELNGTLLGTSHFGQLCGPVPDAPHRRRSVLMRPSMFSLIVRAGFQILLVGRDGAVEGLSSR